MFSITHNFCSPCRIKEGPTLLQHPSFQERDPQDADVGIRLLRSESPFVSYHCQCGVLAIIVSRKCFLVLLCQRGCDVSCFDVCAVSLVGRDPKFCCSRLTTETCTSFESASSMNRILVGLGMSKCVMDELEQVIDCAARSFNRFPRPCSLSLSPSPTKL